MNELHLFAGAGGGILGGELLGHRAVCAVEIEEYPRRVLLQRQRDGILPKFPIWDDICTFDGRPWNGIVDIVAGGFPCQDISVAGKGKGIEGERSGLWGEMSRVVNEVQPRFVFVENSPMLTSRGLGVVLGDLAKMGYNARWCVLGADDLGAPHRRKRIWILAYTSDSSDSAVSRPQRKEDEIQGVSREEGHARGAFRADIDSEILANSNNINAQGYEYKQFNEEERSEHGERSVRPQSFTPSIEWWEYDPAEELPNANCSGLQEKRPEQQTAGIEQLRTCKEWTTEPGLGRVAHGVADRVDRLKSIGNGQVPAVAATAFTILSEGLI